MEPLRFRLSPGGSDCAMKAQSDGPMAQIEPRLDLDSCPDIATGLGSSRNLYRNKSFRAPSNPPGQLPRHGQRDVKLKTTVWKCGISGPIGIRSGLGGLKGTCFTLHGNPW